MVVVGAYGGDSSAAKDQDKDQDKESKIFATDPFGLESGLVLVTMTHQGKGSFVVNLLSARQEETAAAPGSIEFSGGQNGGSATEVARALADVEGPVNISRAVNIPVAGKHILDVKADGPWTIEVEQPRPSSAPKTTSFSGQNDTATPFFELSSGLKRITTTNLDEENFDASLIGEDGNPAKVSVIDKHKGEAGSGRTATSSTVDVPEDGIYLFDVHSDTLWTVEISDVDRPADAEQASPAGQGAPAGFGPVSFSLINLAWAVVLAAIIRLSPS